jgi:hypothetical protein
MKFKLTKASSHTFKEEINISTLEELEAISKRFDLGTLVVDFPYPTNDKTGSIVVYDDYLE